MKKLLSILFIVIMVISSFVLFGSAANYTWKLAHGRTIGEDLDIDANWFVNQLKEKTNGRINIDVFPNYQLGDYTVVQERVSLGEIEMNFGPTASGRDKRLEVGQMNYLVSNWEEVQKVYKRGGVFTNIIADLLEQQNIKYICGWPFYFGGIALTKEPLNPTDPDAHSNTKIRVPPSRSYQLTASTLGYLATPIPWSEAYTAIQSGIVDGVIGGGAEGYYKNFRDVIKYYLPINDHLEIHFLYMNLDLWNSLPEELQQIISDLAVELEDRRFVIAEEQEKASEQKLIDYGIKVIPFTDEELARFERKVHENVWPKVKEDIGAELIDKIVADLEE